VMMEGIVLGDALVLAVDGYKVSVNNKWEDIVRERRLYKEKEAVEIIVATLLAFYKVIHEWRDEE